MIKPQIRDIDKFLEYAMFVPEWPSTGVDSQQEHSNALGSNIEPGNDISVDAEMNDDLTGFDPFGLNSDPADHTIIDAIELTHDQTTGVTSVTKEGTEADNHLEAEEGDAMDQCAMWSASFPNEDYAHRNHGIVTNTTTVLTSLGGGDIWSTEAFAFESPLKDLLDSNNFRLVDLLAQDELLQELRGCESRLIDYFSKPEVVAGLVECVICEVPYKDEESGKERWCREELERRTKLKEEMQRRGQAGISSFNETDDDDDGALWPKRRAPTVLATTDETNDDPHIEASWNSPIKNLDFVTPKHELAIDEQRPLEEEYDLRYVRYPYMACEVLCSDVGVTLDVLVNGYEHIIDDDDDSLLNCNTGGVGMQEIKMTEQEEMYDNISVYLDDKPNREVSLESTSHEGHHLEYSQQLNSPPTPLDAQTPQRRLLDLLFSVLIDTPASSLDDRRAGYLEKILVLLFRKHSQAMSDYMNTSLIITSKSTEMSKHSFGKETSTYNQESTYLSFLPSLDSLGSEAGSQILPLTVHQTINSNNLMSLDSVSIHTPPMLMCALFDHLHCHSIMHIIQRLLIPSAARQQKSTKEAQGDTNRDNDTDNPNSAINDHFMNTISQINETGKQSQSSNDDEDEMSDDELENSLNHLFQCDWSAQPTHALDLLLLRLEGNSEPFLLKFKFPVGYAESLNEDLENLASEDEKYDAKLSCSQHASEILISIIQNSSLDSPVLISLSSEQCLSRILYLMNEPLVFVPHESIMTCAMTVLENLILQLGGYGAVSTPAASYSSGVVQSSSPPSSFRETDKSFSLTELGPHTPATSPSATDVLPSVATAAALIRHLPILLENLSSLLVHPATKMWTISTQYAHCEPRPILGNARLRILRLMESLVLLGDPTADLLLQQSDCLESCLDLFWNFEWCSMLHQIVANLLVHVFEGGDRRAGLQDYFIYRCRLLEKLMDSFSGGSFEADLGRESHEVEEEKLENGTDDRAKVEASAELGENLMGMKMLYQDHVTSSLESLDGSESDSSVSGKQVDADDGDAVPFVSEDDVESALEKEEQDIQAVNDTSVLIDSVHNTGDAEVLDNIAKTTQTVESRQDEKIPFRRGYMGHVIIICQAIVNACNAVSQTNDQCNTTVKSQEREPLQNQHMPQHSSDSAEFECVAVHSVASGNSPYSTTRRDLSPVRIGDESEPMSPILKAPSSPNDVESLTLSPLDSQLPQEVSAPHLLLTLREHPIFDRWQSFISSTLVTEMRVQSSPLGGHHFTKDSCASVGSDSKNRVITVIDDDSDNDFLGGDHGVFRGIAVGEIDMDENDLDLAAQMMESLSLGPTSGQPIGHNRRNHVIGGGMRLGSEETANVQERNIGNFGSLIQSNNNFGSKDYVYDDPLGQVRPFVNDDSSDDEEMTFSSASNVSKENLESNKASLSKSGSTDEDDDDDDDTPRVMDLFTGNFSDNFADDPPAEGSNSYDTGWANFDDAFAFDDSFTGTS